MLIENYKRHEEIDLAFIFFRDRGTGLYSEGGGGRDAAQNETDERCAERELAEESAGLARAGDPAITPAWLETNGMTRVLLKDFGAYPGPGNGWPVRDAYGEGIVLHHRTANLAHKTIGLLADLTGRRGGLVLPVRLKTDQGGCKDGVGAAAARRRTRGTGAGRSTVCYRNQ